MIHLWNREFTRGELLRRVGDISQLASAQPFELCDGPERGVRGVWLRNAAGLALAVLADRGLGIGDLWYGGAPLAYRTPAGPAHPAYYEPAGLGWLRSWPGGFLTPCGLSQVGSPCNDGGQQLGLHGRAAHLPARSLAWGGEWAGQDDYHVWVQGELRESAMFGENLRLTRRIALPLDRPVLWIEDRVENLGFAPAPHMFLQHINLGFPLVSAASRLELPARRTEARDEAARPGLADCLIFEDPQPGYAEQVFYHYLEGDPQGGVEVRFTNPALFGGLGLVLRYSLHDYPILVEWKMMGEGAYVVGLEPANCHVGGRCAERERGSLVVLQPGETRRYRLEVEIEGM